MYCYRMESLLIWEVYLGNMQFFKSCFTVLWNLYLFPVLCDFTFSPTIQEGSLSPYPAFSSTFMFLVVVLDDSHSDRGKINFKGK